MKSGIVDVSMPNFRIAVILRKKMQKTKPGTGLGIVADNENSEYATQYGLC